MTSDAPQVPFGAVYFRKSNPPKADWERDYGVAREDGLNTFRHWFMWSVIERRPGVFDWDDFDRQLDLAAQNGMKTIIAEMSMTTPDWAIRKFADGRQIFADGRPLHSTMSQSSAVSGFGQHNGSGSGVLTFNHPGVKETAGTFLSELATRYKGHPGLWGYDIWNECNYSEFIDFSEPTKTEFRKWLKEKYGSLDDLAHVWHSYSYAEWEDIEPPREILPYAEGLDWIRFKRENNHGHMQFRIDTIRGVDPDAIIVAHGVAGYVNDMASRGSDDWLAAGKVDAYGYTFIQGRKGAQAWRNFFPSDLIRGASRGKPFWHAERQGGPLWMQPQVRGRDKEDGRVATPGDIRVWCMSSFAGGATGMMNLRYRPLLNGPLFGAFGSYGMDGGRTPRSQAVSNIAKWANAAEQKVLFEAKPVRGDIGLLVVPEVQEFDYLLSNQGGFDTYAASMYGAYKGFFDNNILVDWVQLDDIDKYDVLYFAYPIMLHTENAKRLMDWVFAGGILISEACPGYWGDNGVVGTRQPNNGLDAMFGVLEDEVEFMPDIADRYSFVLDGLTIDGGGFLQTYKPEGGTVRGHFSDGRVGVVENVFGKGRTLLIGSHPSAAYFRDQAAKAKPYFANLLGWVGAAPRLTCSNHKVQARLQEGEGQYLWLINPTDDDQYGRVGVDGVAATTRNWHWGQESSSLEAGAFKVGGKDALVVRLENAPVGGMEAGR